MVELRTTRREMRGDGANHHEKPGQRRILCVRQFTITHTAGTGSDLAYNNADTTSSQPKQASCTSDSSYPLVSCTLFSSSSPISLFVVHNSTIIAEHYVKSSLSISPCHDHELTPSTSIHWVQHTLSTAYTQDCLCSLHSHDYKSTPECSFSFWRASLHDQLPSASLPWELKDIVTLSHSHICESTKWWLESQHPACCPSSASKYSSNLARSRPPKCISKLARSRPPSSHGHHLQVHLQTR